MFPLGEGGRAFDALRGPLSVSPRGGAGYASRRRFWLKWRLVRQVLCESEQPSRVVHGYRSNRIFRKALASHFGNDVLKNVAVAVPAISNKSVFREDVVTQ